ncbi:MAG: OadG family protein [Bacteroidaceae bacterium]|nr:OadG family protein [Bacteroidaceae bacterium]
MILLVNWTSVWAMTGIGIGIVFCILILLVLVLQVFGMVASKSHVAQTVAQPVKAVSQSAAPAPVSSDAETEAAIATALYLYFHESHDEESYCLTIRHNENSRWHSVLNNHLVGSVNSPNK